MFSATLPGEGEVNSRSCFAVFEKLNLTLMPATCMLWDLKRVIRCVHSFMIAFLEPLQ